MAYMYGVIKPQHESEEAIYVMSEALNHRHAVSASYT